MNILRLKPSDDIEKEINSLSGPSIVYLEEGIYRQKIEIRANDVTVIGASRDKTVIQYGDYALKIHADGKEYNTFRTYTVCITGNRVRLENLTVENTTDDPAEKGQCVALSVNGKVFRAKDIDVKSTQDTLFLAPFPEDLVVRYRGFIPQNQLYKEGTSLHLFDNCRIYGSVDFIFGCAEAYFRQCRIISVYDKRKIGFAAAPAHSLAAEYGFAFIECDFEAEGAGKGEVYLARPWRDFGKCTFINCTLGNHVNPLLFDKWNDTHRDKTARFSYQNLKCDFVPTPPDWAKELTEKQANDIINKCIKNFTTINR